MQNIDAAIVKDLREQTGAGYMACKNALTQASGNVEKAIILLRQKGVSVAKKKSSRTTNEGLIASYIHADGKIGVLIEVYCETDFAACTSTFKDFVKDMAMHIVAINPRYIARECVPSDIIDTEKSVYRQQLLNDGKPENIVDKITDGKLNKFFSQSCLMEQKYYKDTDYTVADIVNNCIAKLGENITIKRFIRYETGEA